MEAVTPSALRAAQAEGMVMDAAPGADPGLEPLRQATASPFDNLVGVMSGSGGSQGAVPGMMGPAQTGVGVVPSMGAGGYYGGQTYYGKSLDAPLI